MSQEEKVVHKRSLNDVLAVYENEPGMFKTIMKNAHFEGADTELMKVKGRIKHSKKRM